MVDFNKLLADAGSCATCGNRTLYRFGSVALCYDHQPRIPCVCGSPDHAVPDQEAMFYECRHCTVCGCQGACLNPTTATQVWTAGRFSYAGDDRVRIDRQTTGEGIIFAPSWELVKRGKAAVGRETREAFERDYTVEMRRSYELHRETWNAMLHRPSITLQCPWCVEFDLCHRSALARIFAKLGAQYIGERHGS